MLHWVGAPKWALAILIIVLVASITVLSYLLLLRSERPLMTYRRTGGVAGLMEGLTIYPSGMASFQGKLVNREMKLSDDDLKAIRLLLKELASLGHSEYGAKPGTADFLSHSLVSEEYGIRLSWVDPWASEEVPFQLEAASVLMTKLFSEAMGGGFEARFGSSSGGISIRVELDGIVMEVHDEMRVKVFVENLGEDVPFDHPIKVSGECVVAEILRQAVLGKGRYEMNLMIGSDCGEKLLRVIISSQNVSVEVPIFVIERGDPR
ncbi:MAG: hypothetical protein QXX48_07580 [Candidatus Korarchaeum sp.]